MPHLVEMTQLLGILVPLGGVIFWLGNLSSKTVQHRKELDTLWSRIDQVLELMRAGHHGDCPVMQHPERYKLPPGDGNT